MTTLSALVSAPSIGEILALYREPAFSVRVWLEETHEWFDVAIWCDWNEAMDYAEQEIMRKNLVRIDTDADMMLLAQYAGIR